jgi:C_GCAxxG_C_C family probable redox protein
MEHTDIINDKEKQDTARLLIADESLTYAQKAKELFKLGYNCAQAVFMAFYEEYNMDFDTALRLSSSFGGGMGQLREVCGAVSGMLMVAGLKYGYSDPMDKQGKAGHYERIRELAGGFKEENGSMICRELLGLSTAEHQEERKILIKKKPCGELVENAASILENYIKQNPDTAGEKMF